MSYSPPINQSGLPASRGGSHFGNPAETYERRREYFGRARHTGGLGGITGVFDSGNYSSGSNFSSFSGIGGGCGSGFGGMPALSTYASLGQIGLGAQGARRGRYSHCVPDDRGGFGFAIPSLSLPPLSMPPTPTLDSSKIFEIAFGYNRPCPPERHRSRRRPEPKPRPPEPADKPRVCAGDPWSSDKSAKISYEELVRELSLVSNSYRSEHVRGAAPSFDYLGLVHNSENEAFADTYYPRFEKLHKDRFRRDLPIDKDTFVAMADTIDKYFPEAKGNDEIKLKILSHLFQESRFEHDPREPICTERGIGQFTYETAKDPSWTSKINGETVSAGPEGLRIKKLNNPSKDGMAFDLAFSLQYLRKIYDGSARKDIDKAIRAYNTGSTVRARTDKHLESTKAIYDAVKSA
jgi:hypothetical protein